MSSEENPNWQQLIDWVDGRLAPSEAETIEAELADRRADNNDGARGDIAVNLAWLRAFKRAVTELSLDEPPPALRATLRASFAEYVGKESASNKPSSEDGQVGFLGSLVAALSFDSGPQLGLAGVRASAASGARQLVYSTDVADISLNVQAQSNSMPVDSPDIDNPDIDNPNIDNLDIDGQILPIIDLALDSCLVQLAKADETVASTSVDELGQFVFAGTPPDIYQLTLETDSLTILIESVDLRA